MTNPLVSIICPTYNSEKYLEETIISIRNQLYTNWELLITDDCSNDGTVSIIKDFMVIDNRIKLFQLKINSGAGTARNNSIKNATGRFIAFCDSDDIWFPEKLDEQIKFMNTHNLVLSYTGYKEIDERGNQLKTFLGRKKVSYKDILRNNYIHCFTAVYDTHLIGKQYMSELRKRQDWLLWIKILQKCNYAMGIEAPLGYYRIRSGSISSNKFKLFKYNYNVYRKGLGLSRIESSYKLLVFLLYYIPKKLL